MTFQPEPEGARAAVPLREGLPLPDVHAHLARGLQLRDAGHRILAFYLTEMSERRLYQASGHSSSAHYAEERLGIDRRRTAELIGVGRQLLSLRSIDRAFCEQRIGWAKVLQLAKVATPEHEAAWLERALALSCRDLTLEVRLSKQGSAPRRPGERKGLPEVRFQVGARLDVLGWQKFELAKQKLTAERGHPVNDAELLQIACELLLATEEDGSVPGRTRVDASLYRIVLRPEGGRDVRNGGGGAGGGESLVAETEMGLIPIDGGEEDSPLARVRSACVRCDCECIRDESVDPDGGDADGGDADGGDADGGDADGGDADGGDAEGDAPRDVPTPPGLRKRVLARDGARCRSCGSRRQLMVHHIRFRSQGGRTRASNLITLCVTCHSLVHAVLLVLEGGRADRIAFLDAQGRRLGSPDGPVPAAELERLLASELLPSELLPSELPTSELHAERSAHGAAAPERQAPLAKEAAFAGILGQEGLVERLDLAAVGSKARGRGFPHTLFVGPPGTGKTMLARAIAARLGARLVETSGPLLQDVRGLLDALRSVGEGDVLFFDEVHAVPRSVLEALYQAMVDRRMGDLALPAFTVVAATTERGDLPKALRSRFGLQEDLGYYATDTLEELVVHAAAVQGVRAERSAASRLAESARGTPREALRLLDRALDEVAARSAAIPQDATRAPDVLDRDAVEATLTRLGYDEAGLMPAERRYLALLHEARGPVPLQRMARTLGASVRTVLECIEPHLFRLGLVQMTSRGRIAGTCRTFGA